MNIDLRLRTPALSVTPAAAGFRVELPDGDGIDARKVLLATGGRTSIGEAATGDGYSVAAALGHTIVEPVPSLFSFECRETWLNSLAGVAVPDAVVRVGEGRRALSRRGPVLITHRGVSGPAVLTLSAWAARELHDLGYCFQLAVDWLPEPGMGGIGAVLQDGARKHGKQQIAAGGPGRLPRRLWTALVHQAGLDDEHRWGELDRGARERLAASLCDTRLAIGGQSSNKEEFVTCGGVDLREVDFRTMASRVCPGLYLAGEVLDIDGVTGGFNFQSCWTTGRLAGLAMAS